MILTIKIILILSFLIILIQDIRNRAVYWFLFPLSGLCAGILYYNDTLSELFAASIVINLTFIGLLIAIVFIYAKLKLKTSLKHVIGLGDVLLFVALAFSFSSVSFLILFIFSLVFALVIHKVIKPQPKYKDLIPLAGYMSLFFAITYLAFWIGITPSLYTL